MIEVDLNLNKNKASEFLQVLEIYADVFAWHKGELGCCVVGEHEIDTQGLPPCHTGHNRLFFWEEVEVDWW